MDSAAQQSSAMSTSSALQANLTILLVDDDDAFRRGLADNLRDDGHTVLEYGGPDDIPPSTLGNLNVVVTDYEMPGTNGLRFADHVHATRPSLPIVVLTAHRNAAFVIEAAARSFVHLVYKPVVYQRLHQLLCALVGDLPHQ